MSTHGKRLHRTGHAGALLSIGAPYNVRPEGPRMPSKSELLGKPAPKTLSCRRHSPALPVDDSSVRGLGLPAISAHTHLLQQPRDPGMAEWSSSPPTDKEEEEEDIACLGNLAEARFEQVKENRGNNKKTKLTTKHTWTKPKVTRLIKTAYYFASATTAFGSPFIFM